MRGLCSEGHHAHACRSSSKHVVRAQESYTNTSVLGQWDNCHHKEQEMHKNAHCNRVSTHPLSQATGHRWSGLKWWKPWPTSPVTAGRTDKAAWLLRSKLLSRTKMQFHVIHIRTSYHSHRKGSQLGMCETNTQLSVNIKCTLPYSFTLFS